MKLLEGANNAGQDFMDSLAHWSVVQLALVEFVIEMVDTAASAKEDITAHFVM